MALSATNGKCPWEARRENLSLCLSLSAGERIVTKTRNESFAIYNWRLCCRKPKIRCLTPVSGNSSSCRSCHSDEAHKKVAPRPGRSALNREMICRISLTGKICWTVDWLAIRTVQKSKWSQPVTFRICGGIWAQQECREGEAGIGRDTPTGVC